MTERPIIFDDKSVREILIWSKTQTRRVIKPQPEFAVMIEGEPYRDRKLEFADEAKRALVSANTTKTGDYYCERFNCPYGRPGDSLWVREKWALVPTSAYRASHRSGGGRFWMTPKPDGAGGEMAAMYAQNWCRHPSKPARWRSPIYMPRWASRIALRITGTRIERLQQITEEDAEAEGCGACVAKGLRYTARDEYAARWDKLNAKRGYSWDSDPWVWVIEFERVQDEEAA